jgi:hypothetical protein
MRQAERPPSTRAEAPPISQEGTAAFASIPVVSLARNPFVRTEAADRTPLCPHTTLPNLHACEGRDAGNSRRGGGCGGMNELRIEFLP